MLHSFPVSGAWRQVAVVAAVAAAVASPAARAAEPFVLKDIRVEGLQRTDPGTVFAALPFRIGETYNDDKGAAALRSLFATGLFKDVRIEIEGDVVVVIIDERPVIQSVNFVGMKEFEKDAIVKALKDAGIGEGLAFDKALIDRAEQEIKRQYLGRSLYGAEVVTTVTPIERNRVNVTFSITEGDAARIREVRILGAKAIEPATLIGLMEMSATGWLSWYSKNDRYSRTKLNADLEAIRSYYLNRGFLEFNIDSAQVTISPDKQDITIDIRVTEGQPYTVTSVKLQGDFLGKDEEFRQLVLLRPGQPYRADAAAATARLFNDRFGIYGYAFARVEALPEIDRENAQVAITLRAEPQRRVYVRRIEVTGNTRTRDEVVRREFRQLESAWYDGAKIKLSKERVDRLGYFKDVSVETTEVPGTLDQVDLAVHVEEKPTGSLAAGVTYSNAERFAFTFSVKQDNVFGSGNYLGVELNTSRLARNVVVSTVDPYFTIDGVSRALDFYYRTYRAANSLSDDYSITTPGVGIRFGVPFTEYDTVFFGIGAERTSIKGNTGLPQTYFNYRFDYGEASTSFPLTLGWARDSRDSIIVPTRGRYQRLNLEWSPAGDVRYARTSAQYQEYYPIGKLTLGVNAEVGLGHRIGERVYPFFKNFYGGGLGSVRTFEQSSFGLRDVTNAFIGGQKKLTLNAELYFPLPGTGNDRTFRLFAFADAGNVWGEGQEVTGSSIRSSAGIGLSWISPVGPLKMSWGTPLHSLRNDRIQKFQFQIGTAF